MFLLLFLAFLSLKSAAAAESNSRLVSLSPCVTEIIYALKAQERLAGVTTRCNYPPEASSKPKVGDFSNPNIEEIIRLKPGLLFAAGKGQSRGIKRIEKMGIKTYIYEPRNIKEIYNGIFEIANILSNKKGAEEVVKEINSSIDRVSLKRMNNPSPGSKRIFIEVSIKPLYTAGRNSFLNEMIELCGDINISGRFSRDYLRVNPEWVYRERPDVIILTSGKKRSDFLKMYPYFDSRQILFIDSIDPDWLVRPGPRIGKGIEELYKKLHEEK